MTAFDLFWIATVCALGVCAFGAYVGWGRTVELDRYGAEPDVEPALVAASPYRTPADPDDPDGAADPPPAVNRERVYCVDCRFFAPTLVKCWAVLQTAGLGDCASINRYHDCVHYQKKV